MNLETAKTTISLLSAVVIPVVLAFIANNYTQALKERDVQAQFVKIAIDILQSQPTESNRNVREWATQIINKYSGVPLSVEARKDLIEKVPISAMELGLKFANRIPKDDISQAQADFRILGMYKGEISGTADEATIAAIIEFQKSQNIIADGVLGMQTRARLRQSVEEAGRK